MASSTLTGLVFGLAAFSVASPLRPRQAEIPTLELSSITPTSVAMGSDLITATATPDAVTTDMATAEDTTAEDTAVTTATPSTTAESSASSIVVETLSSSLATPIIDGLVQPKDSTNTEKWCKTMNLNDPAAVETLWEDGGIGNFLEIWTQMMPNGGDGWVQNMTVEHAPLLGDPGTRGCGEIGNECNPAYTYSCEEWVTEFGSPQAYWALRAAHGVSEKVKAAHNFMLDTTMETFLSLETIKEEFSEEIESTSPLETFAGIISSSLFVVGGVAGLVSVSASYIGAAASAAVAVAQAAIDEAKRNEQSTERAEAMKASAEKRADKVAKGGRGSGAAGGSTYLLGSTFSTISAASDAENQVQMGELTEGLRELFTQARERLDLMGKLALGQGGDYSQLPHEVGTGGIIGEDSYIAGFFSNGRMLYGEANDDFQNALETTFGTFKTKIVDTALQSGGFTVVHVDGVESGDDCGADDNAGYGSQYLDVGDGEKCMMLYRGNDPASGDIINLLQEKYGFNMGEYYKAAYQCTKNGPDGREADVFNLPEDDSLPACYYNIQAERIVMENSCKNSACTLWEKTPRKKDLE